MSSVNDTVSENVRVRMAMHRQRQADVATALGVTQGAVSHRLSGRIRWSLDDLDKLSTLWGVPVTDLVAPPGMWLSAPQPATPSRSVNAGERTAVERDQPAGRRPVRGGAVLVFPAQRTAFRPVAA